MAGPEINDGSGQDLPGNLEFERNFEIIRNLILENVETDYQLSTLDANSPGVSSVVKFMEIEDCEKLLSELSTYAQTSIKTELMGIATKVLEQNGIIIAFEEIWENGNLIDILIHYSEAKTVDNYGQTSEGVTEQLEQPETIRIRFSNKCFYCKEEVVFEADVNSEPKPKIKTDKRTKRRFRDWDWPTDVECTCKDDQGKPRAVQVFYREWETDDHKLT